MGLRVKPARTQWRAIWKESRRLLEEIAHRIDAKNSGFRCANQRPCSEKWGDASFSLSNPWWLGKYAYLCAQMLGTFLLSSPAQSNHPTITQRIKQLSSNKQPWNIMFHALISVKISVKMGLKSVFHGNCSTECAPFSLSSPSPSFIYR